MARALKAAGEAWGSSQALQGSLSAGRGDGPKADTWDIQFENVTHIYTVPGRGPMTALDGINLQVRDREFIALLGPSGCGKSTLLYTLGGFIKPHSGRVLVGRKPVTGPGPDRGIVFQTFALFPWKTVRKNILYGLEKQRVPRAEREERVKRLIELVGLKGFENSYPSH